jgi:hypothetical protein
MPFLTDFPDRQSLLNRYPALANTTDILTMGNDTTFLKIVLDDAGATDFLARYGAQELLFGLRQRLGVAKGRNRAVAELSGTVLLKYDPDGRLDQIFMEDAGARLRLVRCVELARTILRQVTDTDFVAPSALLEQILARFFSIESGDRDSRQVVKQKFTTTFQGMNGSVRIAASRPINQSASGYVTWKKGSEVSGDVPSPYKARGTPHDGTERLAGSVHVDLSVFRSDADPWTDEGIAGLIIHEASHRHCFTEDHAYVHDGDKFDQLSRALKLDTADAYGYTAVSLHRGVVIGPPLRLAAP